MQRDPPKAPYEIGRWVEVAARPKWRGQRTPHNHATGAEEDAVRYFLHSYRAQFTSNDLSFERKI